MLDEVTMLTAHGLLHLLGWDHDTDAKERRMTAETERLCRAAAPISKAGARRALSKKKSASKTASRPKKNQATRGVKRRRSSTR